RANGLRAPAPRRGLRLPAHAAGRLPQGRPHPLVRRHLRGAHEEGAGPRLPGRRGSRAPLPPQLRQEPVLQLHARGQDARGPHAALAGAGRPKGAPEAAEGGGRGVSGLRHPFVDFRARVAAIRTELDAAVARVLDSGWFILGPEGEAFERELARAMGAKEAVAVANGTEALQLALLVLGVGPGDEVVTSAHSAAFTGLAILAAGAPPAFVDVDPERLTGAPAAVAGAPTPRPGAIAPVHLYGCPADLDPILEVGRARGIPVLEDACQAHGAQYKGRTVGTIGDAGALSFYPTKNLGALGDGGAVLVNDPALA